MKEVAKFYYDTTRNPDSEEGKHMIHISNHGMTTLASLCGHCDRVEWGWVWSYDKPTCPTCLLVWDMVKNGKL